MTRLKRNVVYKLLERRPVNRKTGVTSDHTHHRSRQTEKSSAPEAYRLRGTGKHYEFLTNHFRLSPKTITNIYKERWKVELFCKEIKQNPRIKIFADNSGNAVLIRIYMTLTVYLLLVYQKFLSRPGLSVQQLFQFIQLNLPGAASLQEFLNSRRPKINNTYDLSLLHLAA